MVWLYYITAIWPPQCSVTVGVATQGSLSSLWAWLSGFVIGLPPHASVCAEWVLNAYNSHQQLWAEEQRGLFHHGTHQRSELPQTGAMVQIQRRKPQHEADVRRGSGQIQQVQVKHMRRFTSTLALHLVFLSCIRCFEDLHLGHKAYMSKSLVYNTIDALFL